MHRANQISRMFRHIILSREGMLLTGLAILSCLFVIISTTTPNWVEITHHGDEATFGLWKVCYSRQYATTICAEKSNVELKKIYNPGGIPVFTLSENQLFVTTGIVIQAINVRD